MAQHLTLGWRARVCVQDPETARNGFSMVYDMNGFGWKNFDANAEKMFLVRMCWTAGCVGCALTQSHDARMMRQDVFQDRIPLRYKAMIGVHARTWIPWTVPTCRNAVLLTVWWRFLSGIVMLSMVLSCHPQDDATVHEEEVARSDENRAGVQGHRGVHAQCRSPHLLWWDVRLFHREVGGGAGRRTSTSPGKALGSEPRAERAIEEVDGRPTLHSFVSFFFLGATTHTNTQLDCKPSFLAFTQDGSTRAHQQLG